MKSTQKPTTELLQTKNQSRNEFQAEEGTATQIDDKQVLVGNYFMLYLAGISNWSVGIKPKNVHGSLVKKAMGRMPGAGHVMAGLLWVTAK